MVEGRGPRKTSSVAIRPSTGSAGPPPRARGRICSVLAHSAASSHASASAANASRTVSSPIRSSASATNARVSSACARAGRDAARLHVEQRARVEFADRRAVRALHVVGEDLQLGLQIHRRGALEQQPAQRLLAVGLLRIARDLDRGGEAGGGRVRPRPRARSGGLARGPRRGGPRPRIPASARRGSAARRPFRHSASSPTISICASIRVPMPPAPRNVAT